MKQRLYNMFFFFFFFFFRMPEFHECYYQINCFNISDEAREMFSRKEVEARAAIAQQWFAKNAIIMINRNFGGSHPNLTH
jgi:hypothetical protein